MALAFALFSLTMSAQTKYPTADVMPSVQTTKKTDGRYAVSTCISQAMPSSRR